MASREELEELRRLASQRHRAATKKASRLRAKGVEVSGTKHDPRKAPANFKRMNSVQLVAHIQRLDSFVSRETSFTTGTDKKGKAVILPGGLAKRFESAQNRLNRQKATRAKKIWDVHLSGLGMTVGEYIEATTPKHPVTTPPSSYPPHLRYTRAVKGVTSEKSLKKLTKQMEADAKDGHYFDRKYKSQYKAARKMVRGIRNSELAKEFKDLNPEEFNLAWNYNNLADAAATDYVIRKGMLHDGKTQAWYDDTMRTQLDAALKSIREVKALGLGDRAKRNAAAAAAAEQKKS